jgi:hypothetical protein
VLLRPRNDPQEPVMQTATTIGLDIAKSVFQVHGVSAESKAVIRRRRIHSALMWAARMTFFHL